MIVRDVNDKDFLAVDLIFDQSKLPIECKPDLDDPLFLVKRCILDEQGQIGMVAAVKVTSECYLLVDHGWNDAQVRWEMLRKLKDDVVAEAKRKGLDQITCFIPPALVDSFAKRLQALGFEKSPFIPFSLNI